MSYITSRTPKVHYNNNFQNDRIMPKGENSKKAAGNAKKAEVAAQKQAVENAKKSKAEAEEWSKGSKDSSKAYATSHNQRSSSTC